MPLKWTSTRRKRLLLTAMHFLAVLVRPLKLSRRRGDMNREAIRRILVVELWNIGDVVLAMPFLAQLRKVFPDATTTLLAQPHAKELLEGTKLVDEVIGVDLAWSDSIRWGATSANWPQLLRVSRELRNREFDLAFHARLHVREHAILALSGARRRVGYSFGGRARALTDVIPIDDRDSHKIGDWMRLLGPFGGPVEIDPPRLSVSDSERDWAADYLAMHGFNSADFVIGIHPGASISEKRWPVERFREVAVGLAARPATRILVFVDPAGHGALLDGIPGVTAARVGLRQLLALIQRCDLLVCNDSGPMHIAGALRVPTVAIFSSRIQRWFAPLGEGHEALIAGPARESPERTDGPQPAYDVSTITTADVLASVGRALNTIASSAKTPSTG
jgi:heptosyltransferase II